MADPRPIGVFDSGVGGLTVLREILRRTPAESTIYLGDNARAPYGVRPDDEVLAFSTQSLDALVERDVKALVVACNTSTAVGIGALRRRYDLPVLGVIRPGASAAALATRNRRVGVIATPATIRSHAYFAAIKDENPAVEVYEHATPDARAAGRGRRAARTGGRGGGRRGPRRRSSASATRTASSIFPLPPGAADRHAAARLHPLPAAAAVIEARGRGAASRSSTRRPPPRRPWPSCSTSTASRRPAGARRRPTCSSRPATRTVPRPRGAPVRRRPSRTSSAVELAVAAR